MPFYVLNPPHFWRPGCEYGDPTWRSLAEADWAEGTGFNYSRCPRRHILMSVRVDDMTVQMTKSISRQEMVWTRNGAFELLAKSNVIEAFVSEGFEGFESRPVLIVGRHTGDVREVRMTRRVQMDRERSGYVETGPRCRSCGWASHKKTRDGLFLEGNPQGDFFYVDEYPTIMLVSQRVVDFIVANRWKPCLIWKAELYPFDADKEGLERRVNDASRLIQLGAEPSEAVRQVSELYGLDPHVVSRLEREVEKRHLCR